MTPSKVRSKSTGAAKGFQLGICHLVMYMRQDTGHVSCLLMRSCEAGILLSWYQYEAERVGSHIRGSWRLKRRFHAPHTADYPNLVAAAEPIQTPVTALGLLLAPAPRPDDLIKILCQLMGLS